LVGYRIHVRPRLGLQVRAGVRLGLARLTGSERTTEEWPTHSSDRTNFAGVLLEVMPILGPFGRFYFGPIGQLGTLSYRKSTLTAGTSIAALDDGLTAGAGVHGGVVLTNTEKLVLHFSLLLAHQNGLALSGTFGVGFHL